MKRLDEDEALKQEVRAVVGAENDAKKPDPVTIAAGEGDRFGVEDVSGEPSGEQPDTVADAILAHKHEDKFSASTFDACLKFLDKRPL